MASAYRLGILLWLLGSTLSWTRQKILCLGNRFADLDCILRRGIEVGVLQQKLLYESIDEGRRDRSSWNLYELTKALGLDRNEGSVPGVMVEVVLEPVALTGGTEKTVKIIENRKKATGMLSFPFSTCK